MVVWQIVKKHKDKFSKGKIKPTNQTISCDMERHGETRTTAQKNMCRGFKSASSAFQLRKPTAETSAPLLLVENKATGAQPLCLRKDGNVFQITDGRMEILVARLDFSLAGCRAPVQGASQTALCETNSSCPPPDSLETLTGETVVRRNSSNTRMRNFVKL